MTTTPGSAPVGAEAEQRARLNSVRLATLVRDRWQVEGARVNLGTGAALVADETAFVFLDGDHGLGAALAWADRHGATSVRVLASDDTGTLARQARLIEGTIEVFRVEGREVADTVAAEVPVTQGPPDAPELLGLLHTHGVEVVVEGDRHAAEVNGLEVARIVRAVDDGEPILEVGVGRFDRHLTALMHGDLTPSEALARVIGQVRILRRVGGAILHPLADLVPERWLRATLVADPGRIGCTSLAPAPGPEVRDRLRERGVAAAIGMRDGKAVVAVCTVGVHLDAIVDAADARAFLDPDARLLFVLPRRDVLGVIDRLVERIPDAEIVTVPDDWRA